MKKICLIVAAFFGISPANCQIIVSLEEAVNQALKNRPSIAKANLDRDIAREQWNESKRKYAPDLQGEITIQYNPIIPTSIIPIGQLTVNVPTDQTRAVQFGQPWSNSVGIRGKQVLFSPGLRSELKEKRLEIASAQLDVVSESEDIRFEVTRSYYGLLLASEELKFAIADTVRAHKVFQVALQRFVAKQIKEVEKNKAASDLSNTRYQYQKLETARENAQMELVYLMGLPAETLIKINTELSELTIPTITSVDNSWITQRSDYKRSVVETQLFQQQIASERARLLPELALNAYFGANQFTPSLKLTESDSWFGNSFINLSAAIPLSAVYPNAKRIQQANLRLKKSQLSLKEIEQSFEYKTRLASNNLKTAYQDYLNQQQGLEISRQRYDEMVSRFKQGQAISSDVTSAFADLQQAEYRTLKALYDILINDLELDRLTSFKMN